MTDGRLRTLAWVAIFVQIAFVVAWLVAGALEPGYSHIENYISELAAEDAANPGVVTAGVAALGASVIALAAALAATLPRRRALPALLLGGAGAALIVAAVAPLDCTTAVSEACDRLRDARDTSATDGLHRWAAFAFDLLLLGSPFAIARSLWPAPPGLAALLSGVFGLAFFGVAIALFGAGGEEAAGLVQRVGYLVIHAWLLILAAGVLWVARPPARPGPLVPLRPRDFLARSWEGEGELAARPLFLGRLLARRFQARRTADWISDRVWRVCDEAIFADGRSESREMYCEIHENRRVRITAGDLPDGADVWLEDDGLRIAPWRMAYPIGPLPALVRCRDCSRVEDDGTFVNVTDIRLPGIPLPLATVTFRVRATDEP